MPATVPSQERIAAARALYDDPSVSLEVVQKYLRLGGTTFARCREEWGWPARVRTPSVRPRRAPLALAYFAGDAAAGAGEDGAGKDGAGLAPVTGHEPAPPQDLNALALRLEAMIAREVLSAEAQMKKARPSAAILDRHTRAIASLTRSLAQIRQLTRSADDATDDTDSPAELDELRNELARRIAGLRNERRDRQADAGADPQAA